MVEDGGAGDSSEPVAGGVAGGVGGAGVTSLLSPSGVEVKSNHCIKLLVNECNNGFVGSGEEAVG